MLSVIDEDYVFSVLCVDPVSIYEMVPLFKMQQLTKNVALDPEQRKRTVRVVLTTRPSVGHPGV
jgi:hypothetical protein